jgi:hypothetical protein
MTSQPLRDLQIRGKVIDEFMNICRLLARVQPIITSAFRTYYKKTQHSRVWRRLRTLVDLGIVKKRHQVNGGGKRTTTIIYSLAVSLQEARNTLEDAYTEKKLRVMRY